MINRKLTVICEDCNTLTEAIVRNRYDMNGHLRMTTFECTTCTSVSFVQEPHPNSPAGIARRAQTDAAYEKAIAAVDASCAAIAETLKHRVWAA